MWPVASTKRLLDNGADDARDDHEPKQHKNSRRHCADGTGTLFWIRCDRPDIKNALCQLPTHVGTATTRDEINIKRLLRYLIGNPACNMIVGCNLDVPGIAGIQQGAVVVMSDADWAGDVKDRCSCSGIAVWVEGSVENTWYPCKRLLRSRTWFV